MSYQFKKSIMQYLWQLVCESVKNYDESSRHMIAREILKETELELILGDQ